MASGNSLLVWTALSAEFPASNYATLDTRNNHPCLDFDSGATEEICYFSGIMPQHYSDTTGVTVYLHWSCDATSGTVGWEIAFERLGDGGTDLDVDSFASDQTVTAEIVDGTSGIIDVSSVAVTKGANMDNVVAGDYFRIRIRRDTSVDDAAGDANLYAIEIRET